MKENLGGIERIIETGNKLELIDVIKIHHRLMQDHPIPNVFPENIHECKPGSQMILNFEGFPAPSIDVFQGRNVKTDHLKMSAPIYASFRTSKHASVKKVRPLRDHKYEVKIPDNALNGLIGIIIPVDETFGPSELVREYPREILQWIINSNHISTNLLPTDEYCPSPDYESPGTRYISTILPEPFNFHFSTTCPVCPYGAIKIMPTYCYVDPYTCKGQKYTHPNSDASQEICWHCFNEDDDIVSSKCDAITLRKVVHMNPDAPRKEVPCCGSIYCGLYPNCTRGAVKKHPEAQQSWWYVDKNRCNGCGECYYNFSCVWNCGTNCDDTCERYYLHESHWFEDGEGDYYYRDIRPNYTVRMVAHIDNNSMLILGKIALQRLWDDYRFEYIPRDFEFSSDLGTYRDIDLHIWADKKDIIPIRLDEKGLFEFKKKEIPFTQRIHLGLFHKDTKKLIGFQYMGSNLPIKSLGGKRYSDPTKIVEGGTMHFNTPIGKMAIEYQIKPN